MPRVVISLAESALLDLEEVRAWYGEQGVPDVGRRLVKEVFQRVQALAGHPEMGRVVPEFDQAFPRELIHPPFRIVYRRDPQRVRIASGAAKAYRIFRRVTMKKREKAEDLVARSERRMVTV